MSSTIKFFLLLFLLPLAGQAQEADSLRIPVKAYGLWLGTDLSHALGNAFSDERSFWEANAALDLGRFILNADLGTGRAEEIGKLGAFESEGTYWRGGFDFNLTKRSESRNAFFFGARYGRSSFSEQVEGSLSDPRWGDTPVQAERDASAWWVEANTGLKVRLAGPLFLAYTLRYQFALHTQGAEGLDVYYVPGFGRAEDADNFQFNYQLFFYLPIRKVPVLAKP